MLVASLPARDSIVKRAFVGISLVLVAVLCLWLAIGSLFGPEPVRKGGATNPAGAPGGTMNSAASSGGTAGATKGPSGSAAGGGVTSPAASSGNAGAWACQITCQKDSASCQGNCYQQFNVTNETQYWNQCMQSCGTKLSVCASNCATERHTAPITSVTPHAPPALPAGPPQRSPPPMQPDQPSSSGSSSASQSH